MYIYNILLLLLYIYIYIYIYIFENIYFCVNVNSIHIYGAWLIFYGMSQVCNFKECHCERQPEGHNLLDLLPYIFIYIHICQIYKLKIFLSVFIYQSKKYIWAFWNSIQTLRREETTSTKNEKVHTAIVVFSLGAYIFR